MTNQEKLKVIHDRNIQDLYELSDPSPFSKNRLTAYFIAAVCVTFILAVTLYS